MSNTAVITPTPEKKPTDYEVVADEIIRKAINSVMFIDDELTEPFTEKGAVGDELSKGVYNSFRNEDCSIDFYKFGDFDTWKQKSNYSLQGRDMLILDWQLSKNQPEHSPTLAIISEAVKKNSLHFVCIYTETESNKFRDIIYSINSYFAPFDDGSVEKDIEAIKEIVEGEGISFSDVFDDDLIARMKEMVLFRDKAGTIFNEVKKTIEQKSNAKTCQQIVQYLGAKAKEGSYANILYGFCAIGMKLSKELFEQPKTLNAKDIRNYTDDHCLVVNHTIILISNKKEVKPVDLYNKFKNAIISDSGNFLTLMGLEMRNTFRESSSFIGKDIDSINELAFFHHKETSVPSEAFYDFLRELWKSQSAAFLYDSDNRPKIFSVLDSYKQSKDIDKKMETFLSDGKSYQQPLAMLNYYYNTLVINRSENDKFRFGDIFRLYKEDGNVTDQYLLCITAHCDCLYSAEKINNMFYFVKGSKGSIDKALMEGDTAFNSYVKNGASIEVINWMDKPFTLYIKPAANNISLTVDVIIGEDKRKMKFHSTLKENYAQRIANSAFIYPLHVGIFFADTKHMAEEKK